MGQKTSSYFAKASSCQTQNVKASSVSSNSAVITWETSEVSIGTVEYGIRSTDLTFNSPEGSSGKTHNVPLTLLTPNTVYYYLISIGNNKCDSSGQTCTTSCVPWSFTTNTVTPQKQVIETIPTSTPYLSPTTSLLPSVTSTVISPTGAKPTSSLSAFCRELEVNIGAGSEDATKWATLKKYDLDNNGRLNAVDVIKCPSSGK